jgi:hypothetical protein
MQCTDCKNPNDEFHSKERWCVDDCVQYQLRQVQQALDVDVLEGNRAALLLTPNCNFYQARTAIEFLDHQFILCLPSICLLKVQCYWHCTLLLLLFASATATVSRLINIPVLLIHPQTRTYFA